jgi:hypothetical protein
LAPCSARFSESFLSHVLHHPTIGDIISKNYLKNIWSKSPEKWPWKSIWENEDETNGLHVFGLLGMDQVAYEIH